MAAIEYNNDELYNNDRLYNGITEDEVWQDKYESQEFYNENDED